ncbi:hypothetical protein [Arthrobacter rhombi]|uniref:hypothetical protein n=1 Tax=Arthrobacter rhombi TaxID=71253 RepID=UPI003FD232C3
MDEQDVIGFVVAMCATGEARRYQAKRQDVAAEKFANDLAVQARERFGESPLQLKFGPSAWFANEQDPNWRQTVPEVSVDYSHIFVTRAQTRDVRQSNVIISEVLDGLENSDTRRHDEIVSLRGSDQNLPSSQE